VEYTNDYVKVDLRPKVDLVPAINASINQIKPQFSNVQKNVHRMDEKITSVIIPKITAFEKEIRSIKGVLIKTKLNKEEILDLMKSMPAEDIEKYIKEMPKDELDKLKDLMGKNLMKKSPMVDDRITPGELKKENKGGLFPGIKSNSPRDSIPSDDDGKQNSFFLQDFPAK